MRILLITYDNGSLFHGFPMGLGCIARVLVDRGYDVDVWSQDIHHYPDEDIPLAGYDAVCISVVGGYYQYRKLMSLGAVISGTPGRPLFVIGGHGPSPEPEYFLLRSGADVCVMGEGEGTVGELFDDEFHKALLRANTRLLENYYDKQKAAAIEQAERLYAGDTSFRGFR